MYENEVYILKYNGDTVLLPPSPPASYILCLWCFFFLAWKWMYQGSYFLFVCALSEKWNAILTE